MYYLPRKKKKIVKKKKNKNQKRMMAFSSQKRMMHEGRALYYDVRPFTVRYKDLSTTIMLPGYYPVGKGDSIHTAEHLVIVDETQKKLKAIDNHENL